MKLFDGLNDKQIQSVRSCASYMEFDSGGHLFREGDPAFGIYIIVTGGVDIYRTTPSGKLDLATLGPDDVLGEIGLLNDTGKRTASAKAIGRTTAFVLPGNPLKLLERISDNNATLTMLKNMISIMGERIRRKDERAEGQGPEPESAGQPLSHNVARALEKVRAAFPQNSFQRFMSEKTLLANEYLFKEGEKSDGFYFINAGTIAIESKGSDGKPHVVNRMRGPTILGEIGFFAGKPRSASARAENRITYLHFAGAEFNRLEINDPRAAAEVAHAALKLAVMQFVQREQSIIDAELLSEQA